MSSPGTTWVGEGDTDKMLALTGKNISACHPHLHSATPETRDEQKRCLSRSLPAGREPLCCQQTLRMDRQAPETEALKEMTFLQAKLTAPGRAHIHSPCPSGTDDQSGVTVDAAALGHRGGNPIRRGSRTEGKEEGEVRASCCLSGPTVTATRIAL